MRILVTGSSGHLGQYVMRELAGRHEATGLDNVQVQGDTNAFILANIMDKDALRQAFDGADVVIHLAAMANIYAGTPDDVIKVNTIGTWNVLAAAEAACVKRVVICSSDSATGLTVRPDCMKTPQYLPIDEDHPCHPTDPYGLSKCLKETMAKSFADRGALEVIVLRPVYVMYPQVYDEWCRRAQDPHNYVPDPDPSTPKAGGGPFWHYIKPEDIARAFRLAAEANMSKRYACYNVLSDETLHPTPTLERARQLFGTTVEVRQPERYASNPFASLFDGSRIEQELGFTPTRHDRRTFFVRNIDGQPVPATTLP